MASDKDILGKADALLRRHSIAAPAGGSDTGGVPVLTDLYGGPAAPAATPPAATPPAAAIPPATSDLAQEVYTRVMAEVEGRLATELERRVNAHLVPQVRAAVASALGDMKQELGNVIGDAVSEALARRTPK